MRPLPIKSIKVIDRTQGTMLESSRPAAAEPDDMLVRGEARLAVAGGWCGNDADATMRANAA